MFTGPQIVRDGLIMHLDPSNPKSVSPLGNNSFNGAPELIKNLISPSDTIQSLNGVHIGGLSYFTAFAIDYPESDFGGDAASRQGLTPGLDVRSGSKLYDASRALHMWVYNNETNSWLPSSLFNGLRLSGHCYDSFTGYASWEQEVAQFVTDYNNIKSQYSNLTFIIMGSHRDSGHTTNKINILLELGAPSNVSSLLGGAPEWILVGKPGLGADNAYGWAYENYTTNPTRVAHLNFGLPIYGSPSNSLLFDGTNDYITLPNSLGYTTQVSAFAWFKSNGTPAGGFHIIFGGQELEISIPTAGELRCGVFTNSRFVSNHGSGLSDGNWHHVGFTFNGSSKIAYIDGASVGSQSVTGTLTSSFSNRTIGKFGSDNTYYLNGNLSDMMVYNRSLTPDEVFQIFNSKRGRFRI